MTYGNLSVPSNIEIKEAKDDCRRNDEAGRFYAEISLLPKLESMKICAFLTLNRISLATFQNIFVTLQRKVSSLKFGKL